MECIASSLHFLQHCLSAFQSISFNLIRSHPPSPRPIFWASCFGRIALATYPGEGTRGGYPREGADGPKLWAGFGPGGDGGLEDGAPRRWWVLWSPSALRPVPVCSLALLVLRFYPMTSVGDFGRLGVREMV